METVIAEALMNRALRLSTGEKDEKWRAYGIIEMVRRANPPDPKGNIAFLRKLVYEEIDSLVNQRWSDVDDEEEEEKEEEKKTSEPSNEKVIDIRYVPWDLDFEEEVVIDDDRGFDPVPIRLAQEETEVEWDEVKRYRQWIKDWRSGKTARPRLPDTIAGALAAYYEDFPQDFDIANENMAWLIFLRKTDPLKDPKDEWVNLKVELQKIERQVIEAQKPDEWARALRKAGIEPTLAMLRSASPEYLQGILHSLHEPDLAKAGFKAWLAQFGPGWKNYNDVLKQTNDEKAAFKAWAQTMVLKRISDRKCDLEHPVLGKKETIELPLAIWRSKRNLIACSDPERAKRYGIIAQKIECQ